MATRPWDRWRTRARATVRRARAALAGAIAPPPERAPARPGGGPPAYWVERVRQGAPHLLPPDLAGPTAPTALEPGERGGRSRRGAGPPASGPAQELSVPGRFPSDHLGAENAATASGTAASVPPATRGPSGAVTGPADAWSGEAAAGLAPPRRRPDAVLRWPRRLGRPTDGVTTDADRTTRLVAEADGGSRAGPARPPVFLRGRGRSRPSGPPAAGSADAGTPAPPLASAPPQPGAVPPGDRAGRPAPEPRGPDHPRSGGAGSARSSSPPVASPSAATEPSAPPSPSGRAASLAPAFPPAVPHPRPNGAERSTLDSPARPDGRAARHRAPAGPTGSPVSFPSAPHHPRPEPAWPVTTRPGVEPAEPSGPVDRPAPTVSYPAEVRRWPDLAPEPDPPADDATVALLNERLGARERAEWLRREHERGV